MNFLFKECKAEAAEQPTSGKSGTSANCGDTNRFHTDDISSLDANTDRLYNESEVARIVEQATEQAVNRLFEHILKTMNLQLDNCIDNELPSQEGEGEMIHKTRVIIGNDSEGKPIFKQVYASSVAELNDRVVLEYIKSGRIYDFMPQLKQIKDSKCITFGDYVDRWYRLYKKQKIKPSTEVNYKTILNKLLPVFGNQNMNELTVEGFQKFLNDNSGLSKKYLTDMTKFFGMICSDAIEDGYMTVNPAKSRKIAIPSDKVTVREAITKSEFLSILNDIPKLEAVLQRRMLALFCLTGMRRGEAIALQWSDIDWENGIIHIRNNAPFINGTAVLGTTKTENGVRDIPIIGNLKELLEPEQSGYVLHGRKADQLLPQCTFVRNWNSINNQIELFGATPHILRHTFLTLMAGEGIDPKTIQAIAGHGDINITMNRYVHAQTEKIYDAAKRFSEGILVSDLVTKNAS